MNKIMVGGVLYNVLWSIKIPFTIYWLVWLKNIGVFEIVQKNFDDKGYYFSRAGHDCRYE